MDKQYNLKRQIRRKQIQYNHHDAKLSALEGVVARGDRKVCKVIYEAWKQGCRFDSWSEHFDFNKWKKAFENTGIDPAFYANRRRAYDEILPWDHISIGVTKAFLKKEHERALQEQVTPNCRQQCEQCGAKVFGGGICYEG
jgi:hypothetical protein